MYDALVAIIMPTRWKLTVDIFVSNVVRGVMDRHGKFVDLRNLPVDDQKKVGWLGH